MTEQEERVCVKTRWADGDFMLLSAGGGMIGCMRDFFRAPVEGRMFLNPQPGEASVQGVRTPE